MVAARTAPYWLRMRLGCECCVQCLVAGSSWLSAPLQRVDMLEAFGSCRVCLVEIEGQRGYPASCTTLVAPGMDVRTQSDRLAELRKGVMELYLSDFPESEIPDG